MKNLLVVLTALFGLFVLSPNPLQGQEELFQISDLSEPPSLKDSQAAAAAIQAAYPPVLRDRGISGKVQVRFVVAADGSVEPGTVEVVDSSVVGLGGPAKEAVKSFLFEPGKKDGVPVRTSVVFPIQFVSG